ncbi:MAG: hypothetical protein JKY27_05570 [Magnetovibrio sp.]|nr:hypothetical protein [Magnetovibrio sp.]
MHIDLPTSWRFTLALMAAVIFGAPLSYAKEAFNPVKITQVVNIYEAVVSHPVPSWITSEVDFFDQIEIYRKQQGDGFLIEFIPKGERFEAWSKMLAVQGAYVPQLKDLPLERIALSTFQPLAQACGKDNLKSQKIESNESVVTILMLCRASPNGPATIGYGANKGEIILKSVHRFKSTFIEIYHEWRGEKFDFDDQSTWPTPLNTINEMIRRFKTVKISESKRPFK